MTPLDDHDEPERTLLQRWQGGDDGAGACLLREQVEPMRRYFDRRVRCPADAEDLVQRTFLTSIAALPRLREEPGFSRFLHGIAMRLLLRYRRDGGRARTRLDPSVQPDTVDNLEPSVLARLSREDSLGHLSHALRGIPVESARILRLRYWDERSTIEIAQQFGLGTGAVRTRLHRARRQLRSVLASRVSPSTSSDSDVWPVDGV